MAPPPVPAARILDLAYLADRCAVVEYFKSRPIWIGARALTFSGIVASTTWQVGSVGCLRFEHSQRRPCPNSQP